MKKLVVFLAFSTAALGASVVYLLVERNEREAVSTESTIPRATPGSTAVDGSPGEGPAAARTASADVESTVYPAAPGRAPAPQDVPPPASGTTNLSPSDLERASRRPLIERAKRGLADLEDPARREQVLRDIRSRMAEGFPGLGGYLDLDAPTYEKLLDLLSAQQLAQREARYRCWLDPACNYANAQQILQQQARAELDELIGAGKQVRLESYRNTLPERRELARLQQTLKQQPLSNAQIEQLTAALSTERQVMRAEAPQGVSPMEFTFHPSFNVPIPRANVEAGLAVARQYNLRMHDRAATIMTAEQLRNYDAQRALALAQLKVVLERQARRGAPRQP